MVEAVLLTHILKIAVVNINPAMILLGLVPEKANIFKAILLCSPEDSIAAAIIKPPKKSNTNGCAYELATILRSYNPKRGKEIRRRR